MNTPLETILSQRGEAVPEQKTEEQVTRSNAEVPQREMPHGDGADTQVGDALHPEGQTTEGDGDAGGRPPIAALQAERQKARSYKEELSKSTTTLEETRRALEESRRFNAELAQRLQPKQEQQPPDWFENPTEAMRHQMTQQLSPAFEQVNQTLMGQAQMLAGIKYGDDKVQEAEQAFITALQANKLDPADYQRVVRSPNRYAAAAEWHKRQQAQEEIGDDPAAFKAKLEAEIREKVLAEINGGNGQQQEQPAQRVMPSNFASARNVGNRSGPAWGGPAPINDIFARKRAPG